MERVTLIRPCGLFRSGDVLEVPCSRAREMRAAGLVAPLPQPERPRAFPGPAVTKNEGALAKDATSWDGGWRKG